MLAAGCRQRVTVDKPLTPFNRIGLWQRRNTDNRQRLRGKHRLRCFSSETLCRSSVFFFAVVEKGILRPLPHMPLLHCDTRHRLRSAVFLRRLSFADYAGHVAQFHFYADYFWKATFNKISERLCSRMFSPCWSRGSCYCLINNDCQLACQWGTCGAGDILLPFD